MVAVNEKLSLRLQITLINCIKAVEIETRGHTQNEKVRSKCQDNFSFVFNWGVGFFPHQGVYNQENAPLLRKVSFVFQYIAFLKSGSNGFLVPRDLDANIVRALKTSNRKKKVAPYDRTIVI